MDIAAQLSEIVPAYHIQCCLIDRIADANDASYLRIAPQGVKQVMAVKSTYFTNEKNLHTKQRMIK